MIERTIREDDDASVRVAAVLASRKLPGSPELLAALETASVDDPSRNVRRMAEQALRFRARAK